MRVFLAGISKTFEITSDKINTIIIENQKLLLDILRDIQNQESGNDGKCVISDNNQPLEMSKNAELLNQFVPFDINKKQLLNKVSSVLEKRAIGYDFYEQSQEAISKLEKLFLDISLNMIGDICFPKLNISSIIKASGIEFANEHNNLAEMVFDYMQLVREYDKDKLFFIYDLRSLIDDNDALLFFDTCLKHGIKIVCLESGLHNKLANEELYIIDKDLCEIQG